MLPDFGNKTIVKAEILWARVCNLACSYCAMPTELQLWEHPPKDMDRWREGVDQLAKLDCRFMAIYGAEPLMDFYGLPEFIDYLTEKGIANTIITSCTLPDTKRKLEILHDHGLRSLSVSYDAEGAASSDRFSMQKTQAGLSTLLWFKEKYGDLRDTACIMTATRRNFWSLPETIRRFSHEGIWMFFDFIHGDRGQEGTKCKSNKLTPELSFQPYDIPALLETLRELKQMKTEGYLVHTSHALLDTLIMDPTVLTEYRWHCRESTFPGWLTIENTGEVYTCDDFHPSARKPFWVWEIYDKWNEFVTHWWRYVGECPGCCWNTHFDANRIKAGLIPIQEYVHGIK
jgi:MoaA/NifB/PqqE/SkfB family radical SAM enzyme